MMIDVTLMDGSTGVIRMKEPIDIIAKDEDVIYSLFSSHFVKLHDRNQWITVDKIMYAKVRRDA